MTITRQVCQECGDNKANQPRRPPGVRESQPGHIDRRNRLHPRRRVDRIKRSLTRKQLPHDREPRLGPAFYRPLAPAADHSPRADLHARLAHLVPAQRLSADGMPTSRSTNSRSPAFGSVALSVWSAARPAHHRHIAGAARFGMDRSQTAVSSHPGTDLTSTSNVGSACYINTQRGPCSRN